MYCVIVNYIFVLCSFITAWVFCLLVFQVVWDNGLSKALHESRAVELVWTVIPTLGVVGLCGCNVGCMVDFGAYHNVGGLIKVVGHQWYWEYCLPDLGEFYLSVMQDLVTSVDKPLVVESGKRYQLLVTSADVIHSFSVPDLNIKVDAIPGRINLRSFLVDRVGLYVGYCTELCGAGHAFMPVVVECVS